MSDLRKTRKKVNVNFIQRSVEVTKFLNMCAKRNFLLFYPVLILPLPYFFESFMNATRDILFLSLFTGVVIQPNKNSHMQQKFDGGVDGPYKSGR